MQQQPPMDFRPKGPVSRLFRKMANRTACVNAILLLVILLSWLFFFVWPLVLVNYENIHLFYGEVTHARYLRGLNLVQFYANNQIEPLYLLWMDALNVDIFNTHFVKGVAYQIWALPAGGSKFIVLSIEHPDWGLQYDSIIVHIKWLAAVGVSLGVVLLGALAFLLKEYWLFYRHMKWFSNKLKRI
jgi:hypothetical protein